METEDGSRTEDPPPTQDAAADADGDGAPPPEPPPKKARKRKQAPVEPTEEPPDSDPKPAKAPAAASEPSPLTNVISLIILVIGALGAVLITRQRQEPPPDEAEDADTGQARQQGRQQQGRQANAEWRVGHKYYVVLTVLPDDADNLACASTEHVVGRHCAYQDADTPWVPDGEVPDNRLLRPYAARGRRRLLGAGFWSQMKDMPRERFSVKCLFEVEGRIENPLLRYKKSASLREVKASFMAGLLTDCTIEQPQQDGGAPGVGK